MNRKNKTVEKKLIKLSEDEKSLWDDIVLNKILAGGLPTAAIETANAVIAGRRKGV